MTHHLPHVRIHPFAASGLFLLLFATPRAYAYAVISSVALHELGHLTAALLFGRRAESLCFMPTGINIGLPPPRSYREELIVAAAGPLLNLLYLGICPLMPSEIASQTASVSLLLAALNLLPIRGFDGAGIAHALISLFISETAAQRLVGLTTALCLTVLWILALYVFFYSGVNMTLLVFCAYLFSYLIVKKM